jgi:hypothetical protein
MTTDELISQLKPIAIDPKIEAIVKRLENLIPLFTKHTPEGWIDFRERDLNLEWRSGIYVKVDGDPLVLEVRARFGSLAAASLAAGQFYLATGTDPLVEVGGERHWNVRISMPLSEVNW